MAAVRRARTVADVPTTREIDAVIKAIKKNKGDQSVVRANSVRQPFRIRTDIFTLDYALLGGIPYNRTTMAHGKKSAGKSTFADKVIASVQKRLPDQQAIKIDTEGTHDDMWSIKHGVDTEHLYLCQPDTGEDAVDMAVALIHARETSLIVVDSLAALLPYKEEAGSAEDESIPGLQAKLITRMMRRANGALMKERKRDHFVTLLVLNQHRALIGFNPTGHGKTLPGGSALGHFTSLELMFKNKENVDPTTKETITNDHTFVIEKNKMNGGMRSGEYRMIRRDDEKKGLVEGQIDEADTMLAFAKKLGWYEGTPKSGYTLSFGETSEGFDNLEQAAQSLRDNEVLYEDLRMQLIVQNALAQKMPEDFVSYLLGND